MKSLLVVGTGWLGMPLARYLSSKMNTVSCFHRNEEGKKQIELNGLKSISLNQNWSEFDTAIFCFPPNGDPQGYTTSIKLYLSKLNVNTHIVLTSSTGVYPNVSGNFDENSSFEPPENKAHLKQAEDIVMNHPNATVIRLGGLIGEDRHPIRFLSGRALSNPEGPINLIQRTDIVHAIEGIISWEIFGVFNLSYPSLESRFEYYSRIASERNLAPPVFQKSQIIDRKIDSTKILKTLDFELNPI